MMPASSTKLENRLSMFNPNVVVKDIVQKESANAVLNVMARALLAYIFIVAGWGKITAYDATVGYMEAMGVPGAMLPLTILLELGGGLALLFGFQTRLAALGLAIFSLITAFLFHGSAEDSIHFMKNLAMAGGLFVLVLHGANKISVDHIFEK